MKPKVEKVKKSIQIEMKLGCRLQTFDQIPHIDNQFFFYNSTLSILVLGEHINLVLKGQTFFEIF